MNINMNTILNTMREKTGINLTHEDINLKKENGRIVFVATVGEEQINVSFQEFIQVALKNTKHNKATFEKILYDKPITQFWNRNIIGIKINVT